MNEVLNSGYFMLAAESFDNNPYEPTDAQIRMRPLPGQNLKTALRIECSRLIRHGHPVGSVFIFRAKICNRQGAPFLYTHFDSKYAVVDRKWCEKLIAKKEIGFFPGAKIHSWNTFDRELHLYKKGKPV